MVRKASTLKKNLTACLKEIMKKYLVEKHVTNSTFLSLNTYENDDLICSVDIKPFMDKGKQIWKFDQNDLGIKFKSKLEIGQELQANLRAPRTINSNKEFASKWQIIDYLDEDDRMLYNSLIEKATKKHDEIINNPKYKLQQEIEKQKAKLEALLKQLEE